MKIAQSLVTPIYGVCGNIFVGSSSELVAKRKELADRLGPFDDDDVGEAMCSFEEGTFAMFFNEYPSLETIAHEVFHLTHRIMHYIGASFDIDNHEPHAYLHGWLFSKVHTICKSA